MSKFTTIFSLSLQNEFTYRFNFVLWRFRNVLRFLMTYFLWSGVFLVTQAAFGYSQNQILTYVFMVLIVQAIVLSSPSSDNVGSEIGNGDLSNFLVKPISYLRYWFTRDLASKFLNLSFSLVEIFILYLIFKPVIEIASLINFLAFIIACMLAILIYYFLSLSTRFIAFWAPENTWGVAFLVIIFLETLGGGIFPLDILPKNLQTIFSLTPFPYLIYLPVAIIVGKVSGINILIVLFKSVVWVVLMWQICKIIWRRGLKNYSSEGR